MSLVTAALSSDKRFAQWWSIPTKVLGVGCLLVGLHAWFSYDTCSAGARYALAAVIFACCSAGVGTLLGFLFGIPRAIAVPEQTNRPSGGVQAAVRRYVGNTNLEQISDWLTKAIVAIGLIEIRRIAQLADSLATQLRPFLGKSSDTNETVLIIGGLFVVIGFLSGFLWTRMYLTEEFRRADDAALETPQYYEGLMHAYLYQEHGGYLHSLRVASEYEDAFGPHFTGRMYFYLACAYAQDYAAKKMAGDPKADEARQKVLKYVEAALVKDRENRGLIEALWHPGPDDDPDGDFVIFKDDADFKKLLEKRS
jgi:hypothetical protein